MFTYTKKHVRKKGRKRKGKEKKRREKGKEKKWFFTPEFRAGGFKE